MARYNYHHSAFKNGLLSPKILGRTDIDEYQYGCKELYNMLPLPMGGVVSRPGTIHRGRSTSKFCIIPWETVQGTFLIVYRPNNTVTSGYNFEVWTNDFRVRCSLTTDSGQSPIYFGAVTALDLTDELAKNINSFANLDPYGFTWVTLDDAVIIAHSSGTIPPIVISATSYNTNGVVRPVVKLRDFKYSTYAAAWDYYVSSVAGFNSNYTNREINSAWRATPYYNNRTSTLTMTPSTNPGANAGQFTTTQVTGTLTASASYFETDMVGEFMVIKQGANEGICVITAYTSPTVVTVLWIMYATDTSATNEWRRQAFSIGLGYPRIVTAYSGRLIFANTPTQPEWVFVSHVNNYRSLNGFRVFQRVSNIPLTEADSFNFSLASQNRSQVKWISQQNDLLIGTSREEFVVSQGETGLSINSLGVVSQSNIGGSFVQPVKTSEAVLFVTSDGKQVRQIQYNFDVRGFRSKNISILNEEIIYNVNEDTQTILSNAEVYIVKIAWQESSRVLWVLTSEGSLSSVTFEPTSTTTAWSRHQIAGGADTKVFDIATFYSENLKRNILAMVIKRGTNYDVEFMMPSFLANDLVPDSAQLEDQPFFFDGSKFIDTNDIPYEEYTAKTIYSGVVVGSRLSSPISSPLAPYINTGRKVEITSSDDLVNIPLGFYYLINDDSSMEIGIAATLQDALDGINITATSANITIEDADIGALYTKFGKFTNYIGKTVDVIADGILYEDVVVDADGIITLDVPAKRIALGFRFEAEIEPVTPDYAGAYGSANGSIKRADRAYVRFYKTWNAKIGTENSNLEEVVFDSLPFTGAKEFVIPGSTDREFSIKLKKTKSLPMNVMSITLRGKTDE